MGFLTWLREPGRRGVLITQIYGDDLELALEAVNELRARRWLTDASMRGADLREANLPGANLKEADLKDVALQEANLEKADFNKANLREADCELANFTSARLKETDLRLANLSGASLVKANLESADLGNADLSQADLTGANLKNALLDGADLTDAVVTDKQLAQAATLADSLLPDGELYDGRFNLSGDLADAAEAEAHPGAPESMADFYGVSLKKYQEGQTWAAGNLAKVRGKRKAVPEAEPQISEPVTGEVEEEELEEQWLEPWSLSSYIDLMEWPFKDRKSLMAYLDDEDNQDVARRMMARLSATLLWLPPLIAALWDSYMVVSQSATVGQNQHSLLFTGLGVGFTALIGLAGWILTITAMQQRGGRYNILQGLVFLIAFNFIGTGSLFGGLALVTGCVIALILAYLYGGRIARITTFWLTALLINGPITPVLTILFRLMGTRDLSSWVLSVVFVLSRFLLSFIIVMALQHGVRARILGRVGRHKDTSIIRELEWGYLIAIVLHIGQVVSLLLLYIRA